MTASSWNTRVLLNAALFVSILAVIVIVPLTAAFEPRPARFGWQMYSTLNYIPEAAIEGAAGNVTSVDVLALVADPRSEIHWAEPLSRLLCEREDSAAVVVTDRGGTRRIPCS